MIKTLSTVIISFLLMPLNVTFAQSGSGNIKIYSGYLHQSSVKNKLSFWQELLGLGHSQREEIDHEWQCAIKFKSSIAFSDETVVQLPKELSYTVKFKSSEPHSQDNSEIGKGDFKECVIKIYSNDDQEYTINPQEHGKQVGINEAHHIYDPYLIYLILGQDIDHLEIVSSTGENNRYVLDKWEIRNEN